tara:strand:+ start:307 stop:498 length:192 start_codon:yes stop_codon:yes gene_type:complete
MHIANTVDVAYERGMGWVKVVLFSTITAFTISAFEYYTDWNLWQSTGNWLKELLQSWADSIFD